MLIPSAKIKNQTYIDIIKTLFLNKFNKFDIYLNKIQQ